MTFDELCGQVGQDGYQDIKSKKQAKRVLVDVFGVIKDLVKDGEKVNVPGFGSFEAVNVVDRKGVNPKTGEAITIAAHRRVKFSPAKGLKDSVK